jgi:hypothetical protein
MSGRGSALAVSKTAKSIGPLRAAETGREEAVALVAEAGTPPRRT